MISFLCVCALFATCKNNSHLEILYMCVRLCVHTHARVRALGVLGVFKALVSALHQFYQ